jgi:hypothetical protein
MGEVLIDATLSQSGFFHNPLSSVPAAALRQPNRHQLHKMNNIPPLLVAAHIHKPPADYPIYALKPEVI